jgi:hypothetical protein
VRTGWMAGIVFPGGAGVFPFARTSRLILGPSILWISGVLFPKVKWLEREADDFFLPSADDKKAPSVFFAWFLRTSECLEFTLY